MFHINAKVKLINGLFIRNNGRGVINYLLRILDLLLPHRTASSVRVTISFIRWASRIACTRGIRGLVLHLKTSHVLVMQAVAGYRIRDITELNQRVRRSKSGFPSSIPAQQRKLLRDGHIPTIRLWLTLFSVYRILSFAGRVKTTTISDPGVDISAS